MMTDEDYSGVRQQKKTTIRAFFPIFGLVLIVAMGAIAYITGPLLTNVLRDFITVGGDQVEMVDWVSRAVIFLLLLLLMSLLYTVAAPKPKRMVSERELDRERKDRMKAQEEAKRRQKQVRAKMAADRKKNEGK